VGLIAYLVARIIVLAVILICFIMETVLISVLNNIKLLGKNVNCVTNRTVKNATLVCATHASRDFLGIWTSAKSVLVLVKRVKMKKPVFNVKKTTKLSTETVSTLKIVLNL
jgi:hypothetical protein